MSEISVSVSLLKISIISGTAVGAVYIALAGKTSGADMVYALPQAVVSPVAPKAAAFILDSSIADAPVADQDALANAFVKDNLSALKAAEEANEAKNWVQKIKEWTQTYIFQGESIQAYANQLLTSKSTLETIKSSFKIASKFWADAGVLLELYDAVEVVIDDVDRVKRQIEYFKSYKVYTDGVGINIMQPVTSTARLVAMLAGDVYDILTFVRMQVLNEENSLTWGDRMKLAKEGLERINHDHSLISAFSKDLDARIRFLEGKQTLEEEQAEAAATGASKLISKVVSNDLMGSGLDPKIWESISASIASRGELKMPNKNRIKNATSYKGPERKEIMEEAGLDSKDKVNAVGRTIANFVFVAISILAALFFGWSFWQLSHGDKQHMDALWKVSAGYIVMTLFLQVFKMVFF